MAVVQVESQKVSYRRVSPGHEDAHGNYIQGVKGEWHDIEGCDCVPAAGGEGEITFLDGVVSKYSFTIYLPKDCEELRKGDEIRIYRYGSVTESTVKGFLRYQHQCKAWA